MSLVKKIAFVLAIVLVVGACAGLIVHKTTEGSQSVIIRPASDAVSDGESTAVYTKKITVVIEQGSFIDLLPKVYENGVLLSPSEVYTQDDVYYDVYDVTPGASTVVFESVSTKGETKAPSNRWRIDYYYPFDAPYSFGDFTFKTTVSSFEIQENYIQVFVYKCPE